MSHGSHFLAIMNGEVNGSLEEPMDTPSPPLSPLSNKVGSLHNTAVNHCENSNSSTNRNHSGSEASSSTDGNEMADTESLNNCRSSTTALNTAHNDNDTKSVPNENSNNLPIDNHFSNSNESFTNSVTSSQGKTEHSVQQDTIQDDEQGAQIGNMANEDGSEEELDSEEDSSDDEGSENSEEPRPEDALSINSDSEIEEDEQDDHLKHKANDIVILDTEMERGSQNGSDVRGSNSPEIHEITSDNDDCILTHDDKTSSNVVETESLRRSSRAIKRKRYDDAENGEDESDIEEVAMEDPLNQYQSKNRTIVVNDTKTLVEMAAKQMKMSSNNNQKKEPTVVIIDTNSILSGKGSMPLQKNVPTSVSSQSLYQSIAARGTTVTPVTKTVTNSSTQSQPLILPSLTDDMFVVEAPSFIVPYVYEKPSIKHFREFVDTLGKELEEQRAKEEKERQEKEKLEKEQKDKERKERKERGEEISEDESDKEVKEKDSEPEESPKKKRAEKTNKERRVRRNDDDDASWDGESSADSDDEVISDDDETKTIVIKEKEDSIEEIKDAMPELSVEKSTKSDNYFDCSLGKFFINIGINLVQEFVQNDLLKQQNRKLYKEKKTGANTRGTESAIASLMKNLEFSKENNAPYTFKQKKCEFCSFKTESMLAMAHHLETPHMKNNVYKCNFCTFEIRSPHDILYHMEAEHNIRGRLERAPAYHQCANCPFEDNGKGKLARHLIPCAKKFKADLNLAPPIEWEPPAKIPKITRARNMMGTYQNAFTRSIGNGAGRPPLNAASIGVYRARGRSPVSVPPRAQPVHGAPLVRGGVMVRHNQNPVLMPANYPMMQNNQAGKNVPVTPKVLHHQPSISITPLPRPPQPQAPPPHSKGTFVICEICDGYIKDLEQLRNHMQWIHKVKIHPKMIYNRPPLNCQKCQFRFFTDQGLERHLLGSHGLVTSSMQEAANKGKDAGRCPVCGRVYQWKLLNHVARDHNLTLKPAHLSYKCTVCTATFGMYKQFENHVYSAHSVVAKRVMDKSKTSTPAKPNDTLLKPLKINDEITIIPQPAKPATPTPTPSKTK